MPLSVMGWAVYSPAGRMTDFFPTRGECPPRAPYGDWRTVDMEVREMWVGEMSRSEEQEFFRLADPRVYDPRACKRSPQQRFRDRVIGDGYDYLADAPQRWPAE